MASARRERRIPQCLERVPGRPGTLRLLRESKQNVSWIRGACLLLLLTLGGCGRCSVWVVRDSPDPPPPAPIPVEPPLAFQSPEPDCADVVPLRVVGGIQPPKVLRRVEPVYPPSLHDMEIQGVGIFEVILNEQGRVCSIRVLRGLHPKIDQAIVEAVRQWTFTPAYREDRPVAVAYVITVNVDLRRG